MSVFEFFQIASAPQKRQFAGIVALVVAGLIFGTSAMTDPSFEVTESYYQSGRSQVPETAPPGDPTPGVPPSGGEFLTSLFTVEIGAKAKSQRLSFKKIVYYSESGKRLGEATITSVTRNLKVQKSDEPPPPGQSAPAAPPPEPVRGRLFLWPLETATLRIATFTQEDFGVTGSDKIYAEIQGRSGLNRFVIRTPPGPASGSSLVPGS